MEMGRAISLLNIHGPAQDKTADMRNTFNKELECVINTFPKYHMKMLGNLTAKYGEYIQTSNWE